MKRNLSIRQGSTFRFTFRWETAPIVFKPITGILAQAPARVTATGHGLVTGWRAAIVSCDGMTQINAEHDPPRASDYKQVTVIDANTIELGSVNAADFDAYSGGGYLRYNTPSDLAGFTARMKIKSRIGGTTYIELTTVNSRIVVDDAAKTITLLLEAADTEALAFTRGVYDLEMVSPTGVVTTIAEGQVRVTREATTTT
jgi:hypothetical protein